MSSRVLFMNETNVNSTVLFWRADDVTRCARVQCAGVPALRPCAWSFNGDGDGNSPGGFELSSPVTYLETRARRGGEGENSSSSSSNFLWVCQGASSGTTPRLWTYVRELPGYVRQGLSADDFDALLTFTSSYARNYFYLSSSHMCIWDPQNI